MTTDHLSLRRIALAGAAIWTLSTFSSAPAFAEDSVPFGKINHFLVIYMENRSFDNLYGAFPGAEGLAQAPAANTVQVDKAGHPYETLPQAIDTNQKPPAADKRFPANLPNKPFPIDAYVPIDQMTGDLVHRFYQQQLQIDGGKMDKFAAWSDAAGLSMGYYDGSKMALWSVAREYTLADHFFQGAFGGSFLNHFWLVCACTPKYDNAPADLKAQLDDQGGLVRDGAVTPDGFAVNTMQTVYAPHAASITDTAKLLPPQDMPNIGDRLSEKGVSWAWYSGGWNDAVAGKPDPLFQFHHQPFAFFKAYGDGTPGRAEHLKDFADLDTAIDKGTLPQVAFYKPIGQLNQHPGYADIMAGDTHVAALLEKLKKSPQWADTAVIITFDENGGYWDHVAPPKADRWGPGTRIPTLVVSPFARKGFVDHTVYDTTSILATLEARYGLKPLSDRDAKAAPLTNAFAF